MTSDADNWAELPEVPRFTAGSWDLAARGIISESSTEQFPLPIDPLADYEYDIRCRPKAHHWPATFMAKITIKNARRVFYGTSLNSVLDQMRQEIES